MGKLYLIPMTLGNSPLDSVIPLNVQELCKNIKVFIVENIRTTRRYLKQIDKSIDIDNLCFLELNKHTKREEISKYLDKIKTEDIGIISEAGCPGIADPGADIVEIAHRKNIKVVPLVGPSSILMVVMASGFNGQSFAFNGYIPIKTGERAGKLRELESLSKQKKQTQVFIEAPYRNIGMIEDIIKTCNKNTMLCIACDISTDDEYIKSMTVGEWKKIKPEVFHKRPAIYAIYFK
ncbi:MAG: SAM-dependent methyltransferase [Marinifilaceae bacterium]